MIKSIDEYLRKLKKELTGCDPVTIQNALFDSKEHLSEAFSSALELNANRSGFDILQEIIENYGTPAEIAATYKEIDAVKTATDNKQRIPLGLAIFYSTIFTAVYFLCQGIILLFYKQYLWGGFGSLIYGNIFLIWAIACSVLSIALGIFARRVWISYRKREKDLPILVYLIPVLPFLVQGITLIYYWSTRIFEWEQDDSGSALLIGILSLLLVFIILLMWDISKGYSTLARMRQVSRKKRKHLVFSVIILVIFVYLATTPWSGRGSLLEGPINEQWVAHYEIPAGFNNQVIIDPFSRYFGAYSGDSCQYSCYIAVDISGNTYTTSTTQVNGNATDYITIKYNSEGGQEWAAYYNGPASSWDNVKAIVIDDSGNVYVTGGSTVENGDYPYTESNYDFTTIKYDSNGQQVWVASYSGPEKGYDEASAITLDDSGNVYVTGYSQASDSEYHYATIKYDSNGNQLWLAQYTGTAIGLHIAHDIVIDHDGNAYVTGYSQGSDREYDYDYATIKYDSNGNQLWVSYYNGPVSGSDVAQDIAIDESGNIYVTGSSIGSNIDCDYATVKYDSNGNELWVARYDGPASRDDIALCIGLDGSGNVYITGYSDSIGGHYNHWNEDYTTIKYDIDGNQLWVARYDGLVSGDDQVYDMIVDDSGNIYVTGVSYYRDDDFDAATICYDNDGSEVWVARYNSPESVYDTAQAITVDKAGNVYITGLSYSSNPNWDHFTIKYTHENKIGQV